MEDFQAGDVVHLNDNRAAPNKGLTAMEDGPMVRSPPL